MNAIAEQTGFMAERHANSLLRNYATEWENQCHYITKLFFKFLLLDILELSDLTKIYIVAHGYFVGGWTLVLPAFPSTNYNYVL